MKYTYFLLPLLILLNGCVESVALITSSAGGVSSGRILQSSLNSTISYGIKKQTGKTPLGHALAYAEEKNPEKKKDTCVSFIEKTRSEICTVLKKKIISSNNLVKDKILTVVKKKPNSINLSDEETTIKPEAKDVVNETNSVNNLDLIKKSPRELAIEHQNKLKKKSKDKNLS
jgi:hypothetical protein